jgi:sugar-phosphatase
MARIRAIHHGRRPEETIALVAPHLDARAEARLIYREQEGMVTGIRPIAGAKSLYESVPAGRLAIVSAATRGIVELRLRLVGLEPPSVCVSGDMLKAGKPDPEGYLEAARQLGVPPAECLVMEDAPAGLLAAHRAGMRSVAILTHYTQAQLRLELGPAVAPIAYLPDLAGLEFRDGVLSLPG